MLEPSLDRKPGPYNNEIDEMMKGVREEIALENKDVNTVLREAQEEASQLVKDLEVSK